ncbi:hypothetical protein J7E24_05620 [Hymenobacter sp. ISL-91]|uniref:hypothetical protein n=1 Tax=Hymenobacter sp. ISL-91 TaxID=2819151 RepID=UPI001BEC01EE|nr:hypothetical protein [Hymenobacter sp. ISL-91]MBT2557253.1 hypothetical protein [Hymenobacter sp. ISL-91]
MSFHKIPKDDTQHQVHLDGAITLLGNDLQEEASRAGLDNHFQRWIEDLKDTNNPELHQLVVDLQDLKAHFGGGAVNQDTVTRLMGRLGTNTLAAASFAENPNTAERITKLGEALSAAAKQLRGGNDNTPAQDLKQDSQNN